MGLGEGEGMKSRGGGSGEEVIWRRATFFLKKRSPAKSNWTPPPHLLVPNERSGGCVFLPHCAKEGSVDCSGGSTFVVASEWGKGGIFLFNNTQIVSL